MVVVYHASATYRGQVAHDGRSFADLAVTLLDQLWLGVQIFFVISGYCIAATADSARRKPAPVTTFATRRVMRIYPTFIVWALLMATAIAAAQHFAPDAEFWGRKSRFVRLSDFGWLDWFSNLTLTHTWLPKAVNYFSGIALDVGETPERAHTLTEVSWTLCYEVQFYLACGLLLALFPRRFFSAAAGLTAAVALLFVLDPSHGARFPPRATFLDVRWLEFAMGIGVYWFLNYASVRAQGTYALSLFAASIMCWLIRAQSPSYEGLPPAQRFLIEQTDKYLLELTCCAAFAGVLVLLKSRDKALSAERWCMPLVWCGVFSYSLYLVHWPFCKLISALAWSLGLHSLPATLGITVPVCTIASLVSAWIYFRLVERRFINTHSQRHTVGAMPLVEPARS